MHILLFEPNTVGHHLMMLRCMAEDLLAGGHAVSIACDNRPSAANLVRDNLGHLSSQVRLIPLFDQQERPLAAPAINAAAAAFQSSGAEVLFFPNFDLVSSSLCRRAAFGLMPPRVLKSKIHGLFIRPRVADARVSGGFNHWLKRTGFRRLLRGNWTGSLFTLDETLPSHLRTGLSPSAFPILPDPWEGDFTQDQAACRAQLGIPAGRLVVLHYGTASRRKGLPLLASALRSLPVNERPLLVCAGKCGAEGQDDIRHMLEEKCVLVFDRHITNAEEPLFFRASDAIALAYHGHYGSSGVLSRAAAARRWVIASDEGLVGHRVRSANLGLTFKSGDQAALASTLRQAAGLSSAQQDAFTPGLEAFAARHSRSSFRASLLAPFSHPVA